MAVLPFLLTTGIRIFWGKSRAIGWLFTFSLVWIVINVLWAPFSADMRQALLTMFRRWF